MTRLLISVLSCQRDKALGHHETIRQRWGQSLVDVSDVRFFVGGLQPNNLLDDEVWLNVPDDYQSLTLKTKAICAWMLSRDYDFLFKCDCDTSIFIPLFKEYNYKIIDYAGRFYGGPPGTPGTAACGPGYFLSRKACQLVLDYKYPVSASEDQMVGDCLHPYIASRSLKAEHLEMSIYAAERGLGKEHSAARAYLMIKRIENGRIRTEPSPCLERDALWLIRSGQAMAVKRLSSGPREGNWEGINLPND